MWLCSLDFGQTGGAPEEGREGETELTREVQRLVRSGINSDRIVPSIVSSWPDLTGREREFVAEVLDAQAGRSQPNPAKGLELIARWRDEATEELMSRKLNGGIDQPRRQMSLDADEQFEAMTRTLASLDRRLANLDCLRPQTLASVRDLRARRDRVELLELAEMPPEFMGWA